MISDFDRGMTVGARQAGLIISVTADLIVFSHRFQLIQNSVKNKKTSCEQQFCGRKCLVDERGQRRMARLV